MLHIVIPMAGRGSRFALAGYKDPKPMIPVGGKPMIQWVIENIKPSFPHRFIFLCLTEHLKRYPNVVTFLRDQCSGCEIIEVAGVTEGAACTVLLASKIIDNENPLMIANADQYVTIPIEKYLQKMDEQRADGLIMTFWADHPKWSYCQMNQDGTVARVFEKKVVSNQATVGIYNFRHGRDFVRAANKMIKKNLKENNEYYVAPAYNELIDEGKKIITLNLEDKDEQMFGLGTPEDLNKFILVNTC